MTFCNCPACYNNTPESCEKKTMSRKLPDDHVARALYAALNDAEEPYEELDEDAKANFLALALTASQAVQDLYQDLGIRTTPPGTIPKPQTEAEARTMIKAAQDFLAQPLHARQRRQTLLTGPRLILPHNATRQ